MSGYPPGVTLSLTEEQGFTALGQFLQTYCAPAPITVIRALGTTAPGSNVRVPEPAAADFIVMSSLRQSRLETNETTFSDNICIGSIDANGTLTVAAVVRGALAPGQLLIDYNYPNGRIASNTTIMEQLTGTTVGGAGVYQVSVPQMLSNTVLYAGTRTDLVGTEWTVQLDVHGPNSLNNINVIDALFRSEVGVDFFANTGFWIAPLYADTAGQMPFVNAESEVEYRWVMEAHLEIVPIVVTPQQFAQKVEIETIEAGVIYTGPGSLPPPPPPSLDTLWDDGGALALIPPVRFYPLSASGLPPGAVWSNGLVITVVPGIVPNPSAPPVYFGAITADQLRALGGGNLPLANPGVGTNQLWNDGGVVAIA